jgi:GNAT superfamily N-acetyltransferase
MADRSEVAARISSEYDPTYNDGLITAWVGKEQIGSLKFGKPMHKPLWKSQGYTWVLGWMVVRPEFRRMGAATKMMDLFLSEVAKPDEKIRAEFTADGVAWLKSYHMRDRINGMVKRGKR